MLREAAESVNRNLLLFSLLLVLLGYLSGYTVLVAFGILLFIPALFIPSRTKPPAPPTGKQGASQPRRVQPATNLDTPSPVQSTEAVAVVVQQAIASRIAYSPDVAVSAPLFPGPMFPSLTPVMGQYSGTTAKVEKVEERRGESRDELLELVALVALFKLASD